MGYGATLVVVSEVANGLLGSIGGWKVGQTVVRWSPWQSIIGPSDHRVEERKGA